ncbi:rhodanese-like domain-containing protein [Novosphingobium sp.]|uniref:rhodanese-like domain-containing protein n=1 Tax=Novosphingobium sp. TaxID=1874826 RepID=UPI0033419A25
MTMTPHDVRNALIARDEVALIDLREEAAFATGHPLFAAQIPLRQIATEAAWRLPRRTAPVVIYDAGEGLVAPAIEQLRTLGFTELHVLDGGLEGWRAAGFELFEDVNSYAKAFGELVEHHRHTPSLPAPAVQALIDQRADIAIMDARRFDEYATMAIPGGISVPGAELVLSARAAAPDPATTIIVNCAGRTRSIIGAQSLVNAGVPNPVYALRNGTIGWTLAGQALAIGQQARGDMPPADAIDDARIRARDVSYRAGVRHVTWDELGALRAQTTRTLYQFDVRQPDAFAAGHLPGFRNAPGGQLVQEIDHSAPVRGARIVLADDLGARADMTASWLAQLGWEVLVLDWPAQVTLASGGDGAPDPRGTEGRYKRPYEGTDNAAAAMQAYIDWEYGLVDQLRRDGSHGFFVI